jgi:hypothetical protein
MEEVQPCFSDVELWNGKKKYDFKSIFKQFRIKKWNAKM